MIKPIRIEENDEPKGFADWVWTIDDNQLPTVQSMVAEISANAANVLLDQIKGDLRAAVYISEEGGLELSVNLFGEVYGHFDLMLCLNEAVADYEIFCDGIGGLQAASKALRSLADEMDAKLEARRDDHA